MHNTKAYSAASATSPLASAKIKRRDPTEHDVQIEILFCGICHSDLHQVRNEWSSVMPTVYHDINAYINLLRRDGNITLVGAPEKPLSVSAFGLLMARRNLSGSLIGGIPETQEMLDFCGAHNITADVEIIPIQKVNEAYERLLKSDVKYRFSIDMASLKSG
jgi:uncharacterized zinc-type alcohol dehydrogenase-like protein